jgi:hypothetical protein
MIDEISSKTGQEKLTWSSAARGAIGASAVEAGVLVGEEAALALGRATLKHDDAARDGGQLELAPTITTLLREWRWPCQARGMTEVPIPERVWAMARRLVDVKGMVAVVLGGSRATGSHRPDSDVDLGLCYRGGLDVAALRVLAGLTADQVLGIAEPGGWGPWVNGGAWLVVDDVRVDWIYRDLDRVHAIWSDCRAGRYEIGVQAGHPLGFYSHMYAGEIALCRILEDPGGELAQLQGETRRYPEALAEALIAAAWEPELLLYNAASHGAKAADTFFAAGCLFRAIGVVAHALHGHHRSWVTHDKRLVDSAGQLAAAPPDFARRAHGVLGHIGTTAVGIATTVAAARALVDDTLARLPDRHAPGLPP